MAAIQTTNTNRLSGHERNDSGEYFPAHSQAYRPSTSMTSRGSRAPSSSSTATFRTAHTPTHSKDSSKQTPKMWSRPPTPPHHDDQSDAVSINTKGDSYVGNDTDTDSFYSHFKTRNLSRTNSIYSISRVSFNNQITQLTSIQLPDAELLSHSISAIQTAPKASRALNDAARQIQAWVNKAAEVLDGLDARDDADWAAQAGRDGLDEVNGAIDKFDSLVNVYVTAVERLEMREDAGDIPGDELQHSVQELEKIATEWQKIKDSLNTVKRQVELSLEWEELRNAVFEDIAQECEKLSRQVFEMEEQRHSADSRAPSEPIETVDLNDLEDMIEHGPDGVPTPNGTSRRHIRSKQLQPVHIASPPHSPHAVHTEEDSSLLGLYAQMQPLRASLDFLPMRIQNFQKKADQDFPTACAELEDRKEQLEDQYQKLESDAESLKKELGEDRWLLVFRNAGKQALKMIDSVHRSITKLDEALDPNTTLRHAPATLKKIENYESKKLHYCPAIERVIALIDRGIKDRLTVNGEIVRLENDVKNKWQATLADIKNLDDTLNYYHPTETQELRDSVSSAISTDRSFLGSNMGSLGSSPASSVGPSSRAVSRTRRSDVSKHVTSGDGARSRQLSVSSSTSSKPNTPASNRFSSLPVPVTPVSGRQTQQQRTPLTRSSLAKTSGSSPSTNVSPATPSSAAAARPSSRLSQTPSTSTISARPASRMSQSQSSGSKPRWNASTSLSKSPIGHNFRPMAATELSPYRKVVTPIKYTPPGAARRQASYSSLTPPSTAYSPRTSANYSTTSSVVGSPSPQLQPGSAPRLRRPSSLMLSKSAIADGPASPESELELESPTSTATQPSTRPASSLALRNVRQTSAGPAPAPQNKPKVTSVAAAGPTNPSRPRMVSAGTASSNVANPKATGMGPQQTLNRKWSNITGPPKR